MVQNAIHHITAIAGPAQRNLDFYTRVLGLRLVKKTVNFDDPGTYHLYYGDEAGQPGTILTFFPWAQAAPGRLGVGETQETVFRVPEGSIGYWTQRLNEKGVVNEAPRTRFGETVLAFEDPDGMRLALVAVPGIENEPAWTTGDIPADHAIRGFHSASLLVENAAPTGAILTDIFGFTEIGREGSRIRYKAGDMALGGIIDLNAPGGLPRGRSGAGTVHHIAFRAASDTVQADMVKKLMQNHGIRATEQKNRDYFRAVYFREPNGILFEIATDDPGFAVDEPASSLGQALKLPRFLESKRERIKAVLPKIA
ncbi:ring-cleaving dioxygenase [Microvirga sp. BT688]|uniref:ring-cleaving dioxygenase n=1 Tax=Microvirga sp. TaxID=1873136 RepID=UPI0016861AC9|nr:ring-cleaving dioxygenase [Microvirga sp.]MBD2750910.1 ring-cleaving dioxygenase [Microvirga sp.]